MKTEKQSQTEVIIENRISARISSIRTSTEYCSETSSVENMSSTNSHIIFENITTTGDQFETMKGKKMYQSSRVLIIVATMIFTILVMLILAIIVVKCRKYRGIQRNRRRRNRIFRGIGMIPMTSIINERYMPSEER